jgi:hypothetical protein
MIAHLISIRKQTWPPQIILGSDWLIWFYQGCFLPNFDSFGQAVSEKIFLEINQSETRMACGGHVC